jgi:hypothetical protein
MGAKPSSSLNNLAELYDSVVERHNRRYRHYQVSPEKLPASGKSFESGQSEKSSKLKTAVGNIIARQKAAKSGGDVDASGISSISGDSTEGPSRGAAPSAPAGSAFKRMIDAVVQQNKESGKTGSSKKASESSFTNLVQHLIKLSKNMGKKSVEEESEHEQRAKRLRAKYHRNVESSDHHAKKEKDVLEEIKGGSVQRLALRQFSSNFKVQRDINDERMKSNADFFRNQSSRSLATGGVSTRNLNGMSSRNLNGLSSRNLNGMSSRNLGGVSSRNLNGTSMKGNALFREPSMKLGTSVRGLRDPPASAAEGVMKMPSFRTATSVKDLQYNSTPSFEDVPRAPSLSESFKRSASIKVRQADEGASVAAPKEAAAPAPAKKRKMAPKLNISAISDEYSNDLAGGGTAPLAQVEEMSATFATGFQHKVVTASGVINMGGGERKGGLLTPSADGIFVSESGTVNTGGWKIRETGMSFAGNGGGDQSLSLSRPSGGAHKAGKLCRRLDFLEIGTLGSGASGSVIEALHVPTLTLVAMKMLPVYQVDKLQSIARELAVLYTNLAELSLINGSLDDEDDDGPYRMKPKKNRHVLAMYDGKEC